jgi:hypothetical protein
MTRTVAIVQLAFILPAAVFLTSVLVGVGDQPQYELAHVAKRIVAWYSGKRWTLEFLLILLPLVALIAGCVALLRSWVGEPRPEPVMRASLAAIPAPLATLFVGWATLTSVGILGVVALHMLAN